VQSTVFYILIAWLPSIEQSTGVDAETAGFHQLLLNALGIAGSLLVATIVPRLADQRFIVAACTALSAIAIVGVMTDPALNALWISIGGLGLGASFVLAVSLFGLRTAHHTQTAALSGMAQSVGYLLAATGPLLIGILHDTTGAWTAALFVLLGLLVVQFVVGMFAGRDRVLG